MAFPTIQKYAAAGILANQRITFVSLLATMGSYITGITNQAIAQGFTVAGSSNGVTAAMDGTNRCTTAAGFAVRGGNTTTAQSWIVITAANGAQTCLAYTGSTDDIAQLTCSPGGLYVVAGTATFKPTATDECTAYTGQTLIGATASGDRVFTVWIDSAHNGWRSAIFRANVLVGALLGVELFDPSFVVSPASVPIPTWCFAYTVSQVNSNIQLLGAFSANTAGGQTKMIVSSVSTIVSMGATCKARGLSGTAENNTAQELNGNTFTIRSIGLGSSTASASGDVGNRFDWHATNELRPCGDINASGDLWVILNTATTPGVSSGVLWPWPPATTWVGA